MEGSNQYEGRLEVRRNGGEWGTISGFNWKSRHSSLVCRSLGFSTSVLSAYAGAKFGSTAAPVHTVIYSYCPPNATSVFDCDHEPWDNHSRINQHRTDIGLVCLPGKFIFNCHINISLYQLECEYIK